MDIQPVNPGHLLVVPNAHAVYLADVESDVGARMFVVGQRLAAAIRRSGVRCDGVNLFLADGVAAGQEIFHAHLHVFPRFEGDGFGLRHPPHYSSLPNRATLEDVANSVRNALTHIHVTKPVGQRGRPASVGCAHAAGRRLACFVRRRTSPR